MAAKHSGGGVGPFGWTLLGFLAGVAATLAVQLIMTGRERADEQEEAAHAPPVVAVTPQLPAPKPKAKHAPPSAASAATAQLETSEAQQVAEDAAATGMTTRAQPDTAGSEPPR